MKSQTAVLVPLLDNLDSRMLQNMQIERSLRYLVVCAALYGNVSTILIILLFNERFLHFRT